MTFIPKEWKDFPDESTPLDAEALIDLETRLSEYSKTISNLFVQETAPTSEQIGELQTYMWVELLPNSDFTIWIEDGT